MYDWERNVLEVVFLGGGEGRESLTGGPIDMEDDDEGGHRIGGEVSMRPNEQVQVWCSPVFSLMDMEDNHEDSHEIGVEVSMHPNEQVQAGCSPVFSLINMEDSHEDSHGIGGEMSMHSNEQV